MQRVTEEELVRLASFPEHNPNPIVETDLEGKVTYLNPVARARFPELEAAGLQHAMLAGLGSILSELKEEGDQSFIREIEVEDSVYDQKITFVSESGTVRIFAHDITVRKRAEESAAERSRELTARNTELQDTLLELRDMQDQLLRSEKMATLGNLVAGVAHEINSPLGALRSMNDILIRAIDQLKETLGATFPEEYKNNETIQSKFQIIADANQVIATGTERLADFVRSLRNFARLDEAEFQVADIHEGIDSVLILLRSQMGENISVVKNYGDIRPIYCSPGQLNQVFMHVFKNAIQAIDAAGEIRVSTFEDDDNVCVQIRDTGRGIAPEQLEHIFDFGFRATDSRVKMGFGLSTDYKIIQEHKGEIKIESEVGKGTEVTIRLPDTLAERESWPI